MKESYRMELYAQRAIRQRKIEQQQNQAGEGSNLQSYLKQGKLISQALASIPALERIEYLKRHSDRFVSSDGAEEIAVVWGPNSQVVTHRILSAEMRAEFGGQHYLGSWVRKLGPNEREALRADLIRRLEARAEQRVEEKKQHVIVLTLEPEPLPEFLTVQPEEEIPNFLR
ncbi:hypothetical protein ACSVIJ_04245 [Pseudomonas sp. NCHU5208]|uniref:hypothetical protein n=1 Tax=unclassified Pseudomonas TaxID=196821 RepID=UPI003F99E5E0